MAGTSRWRRLLEPVLSIGAYAGEPETKRGGRRVVVVAFIVATLLSIPIAFADLAAGYTWVAAMNFVTIALTLLLVVAMRLRPHAFAALVTAMFVVIFATQLVETAMFGGLLASGLVVIFSLVFVLGSLVAIGLKAATWWFAAFAVSVVYAVVIPDWVDPIYELSDPSGDAAFNLIATGIITLAVLAYFVRQRDRFQARSDDLLHNILPDEIVGRLKAGSTMIADDFTSASVLFADVVGFTPMSAKLSPAELVGLLDEVFTTFDRFVAELALRIRDHVATNQVKGHFLSLRIGINSGPVTAGIIGTHKFSYDLWGDTVNTASRMESEGIPGSIQVSPSTYELIKDEYVCEARGFIPVKGKSEMETYLLISKERDASRAGS